MEIQELSIMKLQVMILLMINYINLDLFLA